MISDIPSINCDIILLNYFLTNTLLTSFATSHFLGKLGFLHFHIKLNRIQNPGIFYLRNKFIGQNWCRAMLRPDESQIFFRLRVKFWIFDLRFDKNSAKVFDVIWLDFSSDFLGLSI